MKRIDRLLMGIFLLLFLAFSAVLVWQWSNLSAVKQAVQASSEETEQQVEEPRQTIQDVLKTVFSRQWNNLSAVKQAAKYSSEELEQQLQESQQAIQNAVAQTPELVVRDLTEEERQALREGLLSQEELIDRLTRPLPPQEGDEAQPPAEETPAETPQTEQAAPQVQPVQPGIPEQPPPPQEHPVQPEETPVPDPSYQEKLSDLIAEVYVLREMYTMELDSMYAAAKKEYKAKPRSQRTTEKLTKWAAGYVSRATDLEKACDASMDDIVLRMETLIRANDGDLSLVDTVVYTYASEKSLKKAFYISKLEEKGLV